MQLKAHQLMRDSDLIEDSAFGDEAESLMERQSACLRVQMDTLKSPVRRFLDNPSQHLASHPVSPVEVDYRKSPDFTEGIKPPRANCVTVRRPRKRMDADGVRGNPFFALRNPLLLDEYQAPDMH